MTVNVTQRSSCSNMTDKRWCTWGLLCGSQRPLPQPSWFYQIHQLLSSWGIHPEPQPAISHPAAVPPDADKEDAEGKGVQLVGDQRGFRGIGIELSEDNKRLFCHNLRHQIRSDQIRSDQVHVELHGHQIRYM